MRPVTALVFLVLITTSAMAADTEAVGLMKLNENPGDFAGKVVQLRAQLSGTVTDKGNFVWLTVKGAKVTVEGDKVNKEGINFVIPKKDKERLVKELRDGEFTPGRITATIRKGKPGWLAVVSNIEMNPAPGEKALAANKGNRKPEKPADQSAKEPKADPEEDKASEATVVVAEGSGKTMDEALKDAFRNAVRQVVGAMLDAETLVKNDDVISDKVLTYSAGIVTKYDEISKKDDRGLVRIRIKATVEKTTLMAKLSASNIAVKEVDGKGLFATVVTDVEKEKDARAILTKKLREYQASIVRAEPIGRPTIKQKGESETTIEYEIRLSADADKYDAFCKDMLPILNRVAFAKGIERVEATEVLDRQMRGWIHSDSKIFRIDRLMQPRSKHGVPNYFGRLQRDLWGIPTPRDRSDEMLIVLCTERSKLDDRLTWNWFFVPKTNEEVRVNIHVSIVDKENTEITSNEITYAPESKPGFNYDKTTKTLLLAPYHMLGYRTIGNDYSAISRNVVFKVTSKVPTSDLNKIKQIKCKIEIKDEIGNMND